MSPMQKTKKMYSAYFKTVQYTVCEWSYTDF